MNLATLKKLGFDQSYRTRDGALHVRCSCCDAEIINGAPAHEAACPNDGLHECEGCCTLVPRSRRWCEDCIG